MEAEHDPVPAVRPEHEQPDAGREQAHRCHDEQRRERPHQDVRRPAIDVRCVPGVIAEHPVAGGRELQHDRRDQQHPDEDVHRQEGSQEEDRDALDQEQNDQDNCSRRGQPLVPHGSQLHLRSEATVSK